MTTFNPFPAALGPAPQSGQWPALRRYTALTLVILIIGSCAETDQPDALLASEAPVRPSYPISRVSDHQDTYFGQTILDPYRWLEDDRSTETVTGR